MIWKLLLAFLPILGCALFGEWLHRKRLVRGETSRKVTHILAGSWLATWAFFIPLDAIFIICVQLAIILVYVRYTKVFSSVYDVNRRTYGEILFSLGAASAALVASEPWIYAVSVLFLSFADGLAAVVGTRFGANNEYFMWGRIKKSLVGTSTYFLVAMTLLVVGSMIARVDGGVLLIACIALSATALENIMPYGSDNLIVPIFVAAALSM